MIVFLLINIVFVTFNISSVYLRKFERYVSEAQHETIKLSFVKQYGFWLERKPSKLPNGGQGVLITFGNVPKNTVLALYPGN